jgi:signal transduction histidine kinase
MKRSVLLSAVAVVAWSGGGGAGARPVKLGLEERLSPELRRIDARLREIETALAELPVMPDMDALGTHGFHSNFTPDSEGNWFEISWPQPQRVDSIAMIPTRLITQSGQRLNYGLPERIEIEAILPGSTTLQPLVVIGETHLRLRRGEPLFVALPPVEVLTLRFKPVGLPTLPGKTVRFFSLAELMIFDGEKNAARAGQLRAAFSIDQEVGWNLGYLTDGQSPLGPPELPTPGHSLGWNSDNGTTAEGMAYAVIDLGQERTFEQARVIGARGDAPIKGPGFGFPARFALQVSDADEGPWREVWNTDKADFSNPGYNPVTLDFPPAKGRFVRLFCTKFDLPDTLTTPRVLLSELELLHDGVNVALNCPVKSNDVKQSRSHDATRVWSSAGLTDGFSSTGKLISPRRWTAELAKRFDLYFEQRNLTLRQEQIIAQIQRMVRFSIVALLSAAVLVLIIWQVRIRRGNRRHLAGLRRRISSDLHDEVGSNLATISLLSELASAPGQLETISRLAQESAQSLREIVQITLTPESTPKPLDAVLRDIAALMLSKHDWTLGGHPNLELNLEQRRNLIFFFKEALHNIIRHAQATQVTISLALQDSCARLSIEDNGQGLPASEAEGSVQLRTLQQRTDSLGGTLSVTSAHDSGTQLLLLFPLHRP